MFKKLLLCFVLLSCLSVLSAVTDEEAKANRFVFSYNLGLEYSYACDMHLYNFNPFYETWQNKVIDISPKLVDKPGQNGHLFRLINEFEWRKNKFSISLFTNLTLNYLPGFFDVSFAWVPQCLKGAWSCFKAIGSIWNWALADNWIMANGCSFFLIPLCASAICFISGLVCLVAVPCSVIVLGVPLFTVAASLDYHPVTSDFVDTKLSFGFDMDGYRGVLHAGLFGLYTQAEASVRYKRLRAYTQAGYRVDLVNMIGAVQTANGKAKAGYETKYVPAPYVRVGVACHFGS